MKYCRATGIQTNLMFKGMPVHRMILDAAKDMRDRRIEHLKEKGVMVAASRVRVKSCLNAIINAKVHFFSGRKVDTPKSRTKVIKEFIKHINSGEFDHIGDFHA